jgi:hypothetical protein
MKMRLETVDTLIEWLLRPFVARSGPDGLTRRIQRAAFALAMLLVGALGITFLLLQVIQIRDSIHDAQTTTLRVLQGELRGQLDAFARELEFLSQSPLIWTAISDSAGRESYLRPFLNSRNVQSPVTHISLLDYRGRLMAGGIDQATPDTAPKLRDIVKKALDSARPVSQVLPGEQRLILAYPILFPYTQDVIGVLRGEVGLNALMLKRASTLGQNLGLALRHDDREILAFPQTAGRRHQITRAELKPEEGAGLYRFEIEPCLSGYHRHPLDVVVRAFAA